jgi:multiple sugar transport system substrate-binding protein
VTRKFFLSQIVAGALLMSFALPCEAFADPIQITVWHQEEVQSRIKQYQMVIDRFNASQSDYKVVQQVQNWGNIYEKLPPAIQAGVQPDIQFSIPDFTVTVRKTGIVQSVTDFVKKLDEQHHFLQQAVVPYTDDNQVWAVPLYGMVQVLWYRKDLFKAAGLDPSKPPATWDELIADAKALAKDGKYGVGIPASHSLATDQVFYSFMSTNGGKELFSPDGKVDFDTPNNVKSLAFYKELAGLSPSGIASWSWPEPQDAFNAGSIAMAVEKGQYMSGFEAASGQPASSLGCGSIPQPAGGQRASIYYSNGAMILTKDPKHIAGAEAFLSFVLEPSHYVPFLLAEPGLFLPLTDDGSKSDWKDASVLKPYGACVDLMIEESKHGVLPGFNTGKVEAAIGPIMAQNLMSQVVQRAVVGGEDPKAALEWGQEQMQAAAAQ